MKSVLRMQEEGKCQSQCVKVNFILHILVYRVHRDKHVVQIGLFVLAQSVFFSPSDVSGTVMSLEDLCCLSLIYMMTRVSNVIA